MQVVSIALVDTSASRQRSPVRRGARPSARGGAAVECLEGRRLLSAALVEDLNTSPYSYAALLVDPVRVGAVAYFTSHDADTGLELWKTDGTPAGTSIVKDIRPGFLASNPRSLTPVGNALYFMADDGVGGAELWKTDGTEPGTVMVRDLTPGPEGSYAYRFAALGNLLIFTGPGAGGRDTHAVWASDGTTAGTRVLAPVADSSENNSSGPGLRAERSTAVLGGRLYFPAASAPGDVEMWSTDGTAAGTARVADLAAGPAGSYPSDFQVVGDRVFFSANTGDGREPHVTDGTAAGTRLVRNTVPGTNPFLATLAYQDAFYFIGYDHDLWRSDGTYEGTQRVLPPSLRVGTMTEVAGSLFFVSPDRSQLWYSAGEMTGGMLDVTLVGDSADFGGPITAMGNLDDVLYFVAGRQAWTSSGWPDDTGPVGAFPATPVADAPTPLGLGRGIIFGHDAQGLALWKANAWSNGTAPQPVHRVRVNSGSSPRPVALDAESSNVALFFAAVGNPLQGSLYRSDGTAGGTYVLKEGLYGSVFDRSIYPTGNGRAVLTVGRSATARVLEMWGTDGTAAGTVKFPAPLAVDKWAAHDERLYFFSNATRENRSDAADAALWASDGTAAGTVKVKAFPSMHAVAMASDGNTLFVVVQPNAANQQELWKSDGTEAGTVKIATFNDGVGYMSAVAGTVYLTRPYATWNVQELWKIDAATGATAKVTDLPRLTFPQNHHLTPFNGLLYFRGWDAAHGYEVWKTDGTPGNTVRVTDVQDVPNATIDITDTEVMDGALYVATTFGLYRADANGTVVPLPAQTGEPLNNLAGLTAVDRTMYVVASQAYQRGGGKELWRTNAAGDALVPVGDIQPGLESSEPSSLAAAGDTLFFSATNRLTGAELWTDRPGHPAPVVTGRRAFYNDSAMDGRNAGGDMADQDAADADKRALRGVGTATARAATAANVTNYAGGINGVMVDFLGAPRATLTPDDFEFATGSGGAWTAAPAPAAVTLLPAWRGADAARYAVTWPAGAARNTWLRVTVKANGNTGLSAPEVFYFGNLVGDTGGGGTPVVNAIDLARTRLNVGRTTPAALATSDFNRDGRVNAVDVAIVRSNQRRTLPLFTAPAATGPTGGALSPTPTPAVPVRSDNQPTRRRPWDEQQPDLFARL